jgi:hypothetical protein
MHPSNSNYSHAARSPWNRDRRLVDQEISSLPFMNYEGSLPRSHECRTLLNPEPAKSNTQSFLYEEV